MNSTSSDVSSEILRAVLSGRAASQAQALKPKLKATSDASQAAWQAQGSDCQKEEMGAQLWRTWRLHWPMIKREVIVPLCVCEYSVQCVYVRSSFLHLVVELLCRRRLHSCEVCVYETMYIYVPRICRAATSLAGVNMYIYKSRGYAAPLLLLQV